MDNQESCPTTTGGNTTIVNGDEAPVLERTTQGLAVRTEGMQDSERH